MEKNQLVITPAGPEVTIREGKALELHHPLPIKIKGTIGSVREFLSKRKCGKDGDLQTVEKDLAIIQVDEEGMTIFLALHGNHPHGTEITGVLAHSKELKEFFINETKTFTREELIKILRFSRLLFEDAGKHETLLTAYQKFDVQSHIKMSQESDTRGNKAMTFNKELKTNLPTEFILNLPVFKGEPKETFRVEICMDSTDASIRFWFESVELKELIDTRKKEIFERELKDFQDFVIIKK